MDLDHPLAVLDPTSADPHDEGWRLRKLGACVPVELPQGVTAWVTTDDATGRKALTHPVMAKDPKHWRAYRNGEIREDWPLMALAVGQTMLNKDGLDHARLRDPVGRAFARRPTHDYAPRVERITEALLDDLSRLPGDAVTDLRGAFALPLPIAVICDLMGIDDPQVRARFGEHSATLLRSTATPEEVGLAHTQAMEIMEGVVAGKERDPGDDLTTRLLRAHHERELTRTELLDSLMLLVVAGHETTVNLIGNALRALLVHPLQLALVREGGRDWDDVIRETLRHDPPVQRIFFRFARLDVVLGDVLVREGDPVVIGLAGAGRDPGVFEDPDRFDITREQPVTPIAFGMGAHHCLGAPLARLEAAIALPALFRRFPDMEPAARGRLPRIASQAMNGTRTLPVRLHHTG